MSENKKQTVWLCVGIVVAAIGNFAFLGPGVRSSDPLIFLATIFISLLGDIFAAIAAVMYSPTAEGDVVDIDTPPVKNFSTYHKKEEKADKAA